MQNTSINRLGRLIPGLASTLLLGSFAASAADATWVGDQAGVTPPLWSTASNWNPASVPVAEDNLIFSGTGSVMNTNDIAGLSLGWLRFDNGDFFLAGNALGLSGGINNISGNNTIALQLTLSGAQTFDNTGAMLALAGIVTNSGYTLTLQGSGDMISSNVIAGAGGLIKNGSATLTLAGASGTANTFTGGFTVNEGIVVSTKANGSTYGGCGNGNVVVNNGATLRASGDNSLVGQTTAATKTIQINSGGTVENTGTSSCHLNAVVLNGGMLTATTANGTWGNWNIDYGVSTLGNGSSSTIGAGVGSGGNITLGQTGGSVFNIGAGDTVTVNSVIAHTTSALDNGLIKAGPGMLVLAADNTYTSTTTISNGTLQVTSMNALAGTPLINVVAPGVLDTSYSGFSVGTNQTLAGNGSVIGAVADNSTASFISPGGNGKMGTLSMETLGLNGNVTFNFDLTNVVTAGGGVNDLLIVTNLTLAAGITNMVNFTFAGGTPLSGGTYTLVQYATGPSAGPVTTLASVASRYTFVFSSDGSSIKVTITGTAAPLVWKGDGTNNTWDLGVTKNWINGATKDTFLAGDNGTFDDSGSTVPQVNIVGPITAAAITVSNVSKDYTFSGTGKITGSATLTKRGAGTLSIRNPNDFTGVTTLNGGAVNLQASGTMAGPVTINAGTLAVNALTALSGQATINNGATMIVNNYGGTTAPTNTINSGGNLILNGNNGGNGAAAGTINVNPGGTNTLLLGNTYGYSGSYWVRTLNINSGLVDHQANGDNGWGLTINMTGGELRANGGIPFNGTAPHYSLGGGSYLNVLANPTPAVVSGQVNLREGNTVVIASASMLPITVADGAADPDLLVSAALIGSYGFLKSGPGNMLLTGPNTYSGATTISNGVVQVGDGGTSGAIGTGVITNWSTLIFNRSDALTVGPAIYGAGSIVKRGAGALLMNGASAYTGSTTVSNGTLQGTGTINSDITVRPGANLSAGGVLANGTLTVSNVAMNSGAGLVFDLSPTAATSDLLAVRGTLALDAVGTPVSFNLLGGIPFTGSPYTIITNWVSGARSGNLTLVNPTRYTATIDQSNPLRVQLSFSGTNANLLWRGGVNNLWNLNGDANWIASGNPAKYLQADAVLFDDTGISRPNVTLAADMTPASVAVNAAGNFSFSGAGIGGVATITKSGTGTLTLSNSIFTTGNTIVSAGTLQLANGSSVTGNIINQSSLVFDRSDASVYPGVISGLGSVTKNGTGTVALTGANTYLGPTLINNGTLQVGAGLNIGSLALTPITVTSPGALAFYRGDNAGLIIGGPIGGNGALNFLGTGMQNISAYTLAGTNTFTGTITLSKARLQSSTTPANFGNASGINVPSGSSVYITAANATYSQPLTLAGTGWAETAGVLGALRVNAGGTWAGPITLAANTRITAYNDGNINNRITGTITGPYELELGAPGGTSAFLTLAPSAPNSFTALRVSPGTVLRGNANALPTVPLYMNGGTLQLNGLSYAPTDFQSPGGGSVQNASTNSACTITLNPLGDTTYAGTFVDGSSKTLALVKNGPRTLTLSGISTALGGVTVNGGTLALANGGGNGTVKGTLTANAGALILSLNNDSFGYNGGNNQVTNLILNGGSLIHAANNNLTMWQNSVVTMTGGYMACTNTGGAGRIDFGTGASLVTLPSPVSSVITGVGTAGTGSGLYLRQADTSFTVADGAAVDDLLISVAINQAAAGYGITKKGAGQLKITAPIAFSGALTINGGSIVLGASSPLTTVAGPITVSPTCTLDVSAPGGLILNPSQVLTCAGTLTGNLTDAAGSIIRPGYSVGTMTINGNLTLLGSGSLEFDLANVTTVGGGVNDLIQVNGDVSLTDIPPTLVNFTFLNGVPATGAYTLLKYTGTLTGTIPGAITNTAGYIATFTHNTGAKSIEVTFTAPLQSLVWEGDGSGNVWDLNTLSTVWFDGTVPTNFFQADSVRFDDTRTTVNTSVNINEAVAPSAITLDSTNNYTLAGVGKITGGASITKNNINTVMLGTANDFVGPVNVNAGLLQMGNASAMPVNAKITVANNAGFDFAGQGAATTRGYRFTIAGNGPDGAGALQNSSATAIYGNSSVSNLTLTANSSIGGVGRWDLGSGSPGIWLQGNGYMLTKVGSNQITFRPETITNLPGIVINSGMLQHENFNRTDASTSSLTNTVNTGGTLSSYGALVFNYPVLFNGGGLLNQNSTATWFGPMTLASNTLASVNNPINLFGLIDGAGGLIQQGGSVLTISNANTYAGGTIISNAPVTVTNTAAVAGTASIVVARPTALGTGPVTLNLGLVTANTITNTARPLEFNLPGAGVVPNAINLPTAGITNMGLAGRDATSIFTLAGKLSGGHAALTNWLDNAAGNVGVIRLGNALNDFTVARLFINRGTLALTADGNLGNSANILNPAASTTVRFDATGLALAHPLSATANPTYLDMFGDNDGNGTPETVNNVTISGIISGAGTIFPRGTNGTMTLSGVNTFSGGFELQQPLTLQVSASANLGTAYLAIKYGSTFRYTGTGAETMTRALYMDNNNGGTIDIPSATASLTWNPAAGTFNQPMTKTGAGALTIGTIGIGGGYINASGGALTINSVISGGTVLAVNTGTLTLNGANTSVGGTFANGGTLVVNGSLAAGNAVTVASGATLAGNGTINGPTAIQLGAVLSPGVGGIGKLTIANVLNLAGSTVIELNKASGTNDSIVSVSGIVYGGSLVVNNLGGTLAAGDTFKLFSAWAYSGAFTSTNLPALTAGLAWDTSGLLVDGTIKIVSTAPPALTGASLLPNGNVQITLAGAIGQAYKILASTDVALPVASWTVLITGTLPSAIFNWEDIDTKNHPDRFYIITTP